MDGIVSIFTVTGSWCVVASVFYAGIKSYERLTLNRWNVERAEKALEKAERELKYKVSENEKLLDGLKAAAAENFKLKNELEKMKQLPVPRARF